jgi:hypothetical protein
MVVQVLKGEVKSLEEFISPKCKGVLGDLRDGKATEKQLAELKAQFTGLRPIGIRNENGTRVLTLTNAKDEIISFKVKKEGDVFKVIEMTVKQPTKKKSR